MKTWIGLIAVLLVSTGLAWAFAKQPNAEAQSAITEVGVEHTGCYGPCPVYKLTIRSNGTATFVGFSNVSKIGTYTAYVGSFNRLVQAIKHRGFQRFQPDYTSGVTDLPHAVTTVVQGDHRKTVVTDIVGEPQALWEIQTLIDGAVAEAHWKKVGSITKAH
jgi:hypothetical protein